MALVLPHTYLVRPKDSLRVSTEDFPEISLESPTLWTMEHSTIPDHDYAGQS
jgi:hypothetical protein